MYRQVFIGTKSVNRSQRTRFSRTLICHWYLVDSKRTSSFVLLLRDIIRIYILLCRNRNRKKEKKYARYKIHGREERKEGEKNSQNYTMIKDEGDTRTNYRDGISKISVIQISSLPTVFSLISARSPERSTKTRNKRRHAKRILFPSKRMSRQIYTSQFTAHCGH